MKLNSIQSNIKYPVFGSSAAVALQKSKKAFASIIKNSNPLECDVFIPQNPPYKEEEKKPDYSNPKAFSEYLANKIDEMHQNYSKEDIESIISNVSDKTGASKKDVAKVLSRLTQFSSYSSLNVFEKNLKTNKIRTFQRLNHQYLSVNDVMNYLLDHKRQMSLDGIDNAIVLDDCALDYLSSLKEKRDDSYEAAKLLDNIKNGHCKLAIIDGFNAKVDGEDVSHSLFGSKLSLEDAVEKIIQKMQEGASLDEIMNGDTIKRAKEIFGDDIEILLIKRRTTKSGPKDIAKQMESIHPSSGKTKDLIDKMVQIAIPKNLTAEAEEKGKELLNRYFDSMLMSYSQESLTKTLKDKYKAIENKLQELGKTMDDVIYLVPVREKSYDLITYQYAKANDIPKEKIIRTNPIHISPEDVENKAVVILDDFVGTGMSISQIGFDYEEFKISVLDNAQNANLIFAPICINLGGRWKIEKEILKNEREGKDFIISTETPNVKNLFKTLSKQDAEFLSTNLLSDSGYGNEYTCLSMPYMIPDNNTDAAGYLLRHTIKNNWANKADGWFN